MRPGLALTLLVLAGCRQSHDTLQRTYAALEDQLAAGEYKSVLEQAAQEAESLPTDSPWHWKYRNLQAKAAHYVAPARVLEILRAEPPSGKDFLQPAIERKIWMGNADLRAGRLEDAERLFDQARKEAEAEKFEDLALDALMGSCGRLARSGRYEEAATLLQQATQRARKRRDNRRLTTALNNEAFVRIRMRRHAEAIPLLEEAARLYGSRRGAPYFATMNNLGLSYSRMGEFDKALEIQKQAIAGQEKLGYTQGLVEALGELGISYRQRGMPREALEALNRGLELARERRLTEDSARLAGALASLYIELGEWEKAAALNAEAAELKKAAGAPQIYNVLNGAEIALGTGDLAKAERLYQEAMRFQGDETVKWQAHTGLARVAALKNNVAGAKRNFEAAIQLVEKSRQELTDTDLRISYFSRLIDFYRRYVDFLLSRGDTAGALAVAESSRAKVLAERTGGLMDRQPRASDYQALAKRANAVILSYWISPGQSRIWVITGAGVQATPIEGGELQGLVDAFTGVVRSQSPVALEDRSGKRLAQILLEPALGQIPANGRVIVAPDGPLHGLNFEMLPVDGRPFLERAEVMVAPSLALLAAAKAPQGEKRRKLLAIGDPVAADARYPRLANAQVELTAALNAFPADARQSLTGAAATPAAFLQSKPEEASHIHFTAHGIGNRDRPLDSAVVLSPGPAGKYMLYARDLIGVKLTADLVTVSACRSTGERMYSGEGLVGFAWAFLRAGAGHVVGGLWDVDDRATAELMRAMYEQLRAGQPPSTALRKAKLAFLRHGTFYKPYYWAPFQLYAAAP